jgi:hypothetical protein
MGRDPKRIKSVGAHLSNDHRRGTNRVVGHFVNWQKQINGLRRLILSSAGFDSLIGPGSGRFRPSGSPIPVIR